jgi:hypothetical protein
MLIFQARITFGQHVFQKFLLHAASCQKSSALAGNPKSSGRGPCGQGNIKFSKLVSVHASSSDTHLFFRGIRRRKATPEKGHRVITMGILDTHRRLGGDLRQDRPIQFHIDFHWSGAKHNGTFYYRKSGQLKAFGTWPTKSTTP